MQPQSPTLPYRELTIHPLARWFFRGCDAGTRYVARVFGAKEDPATGAQRSPATLTQDYAELMNIRGAFQSSDNNADNRDHYLALLSCLAYERRTVIESQLAPIASREYDFAVFADWELGETQCFFLRLDKNIILAFRGTEPFNLLDWFDDFMVLRPLTPLPSPGTSPVHGSCHPGFLNNLLRNAPETKIQVWAKIAHEIEKLRHNDEDCKLYITGHSLGGGLGALFAALYLNNPIRGATLVRVSLFGGPVVGDPELIDSLHSEVGAKGIRFRNYVNGYDIVPRLHTLSLIPARWRAYPNVTYLGMAPNPRINFVTGFLPHSLWPPHISGVGTIQHLPRVIYDHLPSEYIQRL